MNKLICTGILMAGSLLIVRAQKYEIPVPKTEGIIPSIAIPDFRGAGDAQKFMAAFNETLSADVKASGQVKLVPKTSLPLFIPQQPSDFQTPPAAPTTPPRGRQPQPAMPQSGGGH